MKQPLAAGNSALATPQFYVTPRYRFGPGSLLLAFAAALVCLLAVLYGLTHTHHGQSAAEGGEDDPSTVDTIYLGDPGQAPRTVRPQPQDRYHPVHPFVVVHLPRSGDQVGQIPDSPAGRLLYAWLAAFNGTDPSALPRALPTAEDTATEAAQLELRKQTGGFTLVSAKEVEPGLLVFRLHDQTAAGTEALGTLQMRPYSVPASIASFSLQAVPTTQTQPK